MVSTIEKLKKNSTIEETALLEQSILWETKDVISTSIPALNVALSGSLTGGMGPGLLQIAGASKRFKTKFAIIIAEAFQRMFKDGAIIFYDTEFGSPKPYWDAIKRDNVLHTPVVNLEAMTHDLATQFDGISRNDRVLVIVDSLGNAPSVKEVTDALKGGNIPADMTRAKAIKSMFRIIGPSIGLKNIYMVVINHTYKTLEMYAKEVVGGGTGTEYNSNGIWIIGAEKNTEGEGAKKELVGFDFKIKVEKSRFVKQDKKIPITVSFDSGIDQWSGLLDMALDMGYVVRPTLQTYAFANAKDETWKLKDIDDGFYEHLLKNTDFPLAVTKEYSL
jgi:RecA/RadA recombinase